MGDRWRVKQPVNLNRVIGYRKDPKTGVEKALLHGFIATPPQVVTHELDPNFVRRYDEGDENARSLVERIEESDDDDGILRGKALEKRIDELGIEGTSTMSADEKREAVAEAEQEG